MQRRGRIKFEEKFKMNTIINEDTEQGIIPVDIFTTLSDNRVFFINNFIDDKVAVDICAALL